MDGKRLVRSLKLEHILSYGPSGTAIELLPLNVLIGPNGSGKSNLIEAISLLKAASFDVLSPIRIGGGFGHWLWKGGGGEARSQFTLDALVDAPQDRPLRYGISLRSTGQSAEVASEMLLDGAEAFEDAGIEHPGWCYRLQDGKSAVKVSPLLSELAGDAKQPEWQPLSDFEVTFGTASILARLRDPWTYPEITFLSSAFSAIAIFRSIGLGPESKLRGPHRADEPASFLLEDGRNLGVVLSDLLNQPSTKKQILKELQRFYAPVEDITTKTYANTVELSLHECGLTQSVPSIRLSDGTLRYLALLTILCHPKPPPLVCIEDPEVGLHPDILPHLADLLVEASQRMQLIVTTHSDIMVSALSHVPEAVVVCERDDEGTHLRRLDAASLHQWLKKYTLGELWSMGELGGNP